ncbi:MAG: flagellar assembly protein FliW [Armatimonadota bacterium]|nr:flagellar assembly protein FliW [bacterium]
MKVNTTRFGVLEVDESSVIKMPRGPLGFEERTEFVTIHHRPDTSFRWLQSTEDPALAFVVTDPIEHFGSYEIEISDADAEKLHLTTEDDALVLSIVTISNRAQEITVNLAAPIVINTKEMLGMQVVLQDNRYSVKQSILNAAEKTEQKVTVKAA